MGKSRAGLLSEYNLSTGSSGELQVAAHEVCVQVSADLELPRFSFCNVLIDIPLRVNHGRLAIGADQVRSMSQAPQVELFEVHYST
jgi:hypothetical protein